MSCPHRTAHAGHHRLQPAAPQRPLAGARAPGPRRIAVRHRPARGRPGLRRAAGDDARAGRAAADRAHRRSGHRPGDPPDRVAAARAAGNGTVEFALGGFELAGQRPVLVRAFNVLRQYPAEAVPDAWSSMQAQLAPGGLIVDGTCDELGRLCCWVLLDVDGPVSLTLACDPFAIERPSDLAERLPKVLIHHNVDGQPIHTLLAAADRAWASVAGHGVFGPRVRWRAMLDLLARNGFPVSRRGGGCATACSPCRGRPWPRIRTDPARPHVLGWSPWARPWHRSAAVPNRRRTSTWSRTTRDALPTPAHGWSCFPRQRCAASVSRWREIAEPLDGAWATGVRQIAERAGIVVVAGMFVPPVRARGRRG